MHVKETSSFLLLDRNFTFLQIFFQEFYQQSILQLIRDCKDTTAIKWLILQEFIKLL